MKTVLLLLFSALIGFFSICMVYSALTHNCQAAMNFFMLINGFIFIIIWFFSDKKQKGNV